jgi:hypothetical protein
VSRSALRRCLPLALAGNGRPPVRDSGTFIFSVTIFVFSVVVGGVGTLMEVGFLMSKTHKKRAARKLANSLEIPYMQALDAIEDAVATAYPSRSSVRSSESDLEGIPSVYANWVEYLRQLTFESDRFLSTVSRSDLNMTELENLVLVEHSLFRLIEAIEKNSPFGHYYRYEEFFNNAVILASQGKFLGYQNFEFFQYDESLSEEVWSALVRNGFADEFDPKTHKEGWWIVPNELGIDTFYVKNSDLWNENMFALFEPWMDEDETNEWLRDVAAARAREQGGNATRG